MAGRDLIVRVVTREGRALIVEPAPPADFRWGGARYLTGANSGLQSVTMAIGGETITLRELPAEPSMAGDLIRLSHGCDKMFATCRERFGNAANFRGEPHLPGNDLLTRFPGG